jgi:hypothetical protein
MMRRRDLQRALSIAMGALLLWFPGQGETPRSADSVADSVGVNIHLHFTDTIYGNFPLVQSLLTSLGVRHVRDGLTDTTWQPYYQEHTALGQLGIRGIFITDPSTADAVLVDWPSRVGTAFEGYEAPNEYDNNGDPNWAATLNTFLPRLHAAVRGDSRTAGFPIIGPSLVQAADYAPLASLGSTFDYSNLHNYFGGRNPGTPGWGSNGYGSIAANMAYAQQAWPGKPIWTTETGYLSNPQVLQGIPEAIEAKYIPRVVFEQILNGIGRTYIYELIDEVQTSPTEQSFGLARNDGSAKPAFLAMQKLLHMVGDPGAAPALKDLPFSLTGSTNVHHILLQKRDGSYLLAFWLEEQAYNVDTRAVTPVAPESVVFQWSQAFQQIGLVTFHDDGSTTSTSIAPASQLSLTATDSVSILELVPNQRPAAPSSLTGHVL